MKGPAGRFVASILLSLLPALASGAFSGALAQEVTIPFPRLEHLEEAVRNQLSEAQKMIEAVVHTPAATVEDRARAYGELGQMYHAYELNEAAEACYANALTLEPSRFEWNYSLGYLLKSLGRYEEALTHFDQALAAEPESVLVHVRRGEVHRMLNEPEKAEKAFRSAFRGAPDDPAVLARLGESSLALGSYGEAVTYLESALKGQPDANRLRYPLAMALRGLGKTAEARAHLAVKGDVGVQPYDPLRKRLEELVTGYRVHLLSGRLAYAAGRHVEAAEEFRQAVEADPEKAGARINLGTALAARLAYSEAIAQFREAIRLEPENVTAHFNLGAMLMHRAEFEEAVSRLRTVVAKKPEDAEAHLALARALQGAKEFGEAFDHYRTAAIRDPSLAPAWLEMGALLTLSSQHAEARSVLGEAHRLMPHDGSVAHGLARLLAASPATGLRDGKRALDLATKVFQARPGFEHARTVAMALAENDRCDEAAQWQEKAVDLAADSPAGAPMLEMLTRNLVHYRDRRPCRVPGE